MKKILVMLLVVCLAASMVACGNRNTEGNNTNVDNAIDTVPDDTVPGNNPMNGTDKDGVIENMGEDIKDGAENIKEDVKDNAENR